MEEIKCEPQKIFGAVIVNWNSFVYLEKCLAALCAQETLFDKIVVIDNGNDGNYTISEWPENCQYIRLEYNSGFAKANNIALRTLKDCDWVALINPDAYLSPCWLKYMHDACTRYPQFSFFASQILMAGDPSVVDGIGDKYHISGLAWRDSHGKSKIEFLEKEVFSPCAAAAMYRYDAVMEVGGFDETFFCYFEDVDLAFRMRLAGYRCLLIPNAVAHHIGSATSGGSHSDFAVYHGHRNMVWTYVKNMPGLLFWLFLPYHVLLNIFSIFWFACRGQGRIIIKSKMDAVRKLRLVWKKRIKIQHEKKATATDLLRVIDMHPIPKFPHH